MVPPGTNDIYFWFTRDVDVPVNMQLFDGVTGIYVARKKLLVF